MPPLTQKPSVFLGATYYAEQFSPDQWTDDIALMQKAGLTAVRLGDTAWSAFQPDEDIFTLDWMAALLDRFAEAGIAVIMATPAAAPPVWLTSKHPDMLAMQENGRRMLSENRSPACITSPEHHAAAGKIVRTMLEFFGKHPAIIGWQADNAFQRVCYCERCQAQFQEFLKEKYGSLEDLNQHWSGRVRSQQYTTWEQIHLPAGSHHPVLLLEHKRFVTSCYEKYLGMLVHLLREGISEDALITHNFQGMDSPLNSALLAGHLDTAGMDWYIGRGQHDFRTSSAELAYTRGLKKRNYWVLEAQPGNVNWASVSNTLDKGSVRSMVWHAVAQGSNGMLFWHWRTSPGGMDQFHGSLLNQAGGPRLVYDEVAQAASELTQVQDLLADSTVTTEVAILYDDDSRWSLNNLPMHVDFDYTQHLQHYARPLVAANIPFDVIPADSPLEGYKLVIAPALTILTEERIAALSGFVKAGGHLVLTMRSGVKDSSNALLPSRPPGGLTELAGVVVEEAYVISEPVAVRANYFQGSAKTWAERLHRLDTNAIEVAHYSIGLNRWLNETLAMTVRSFGRGLVYYIGCWLDDTSQAAVINRLAHSALIFPPKTPSGVHVSVRKQKGGKEIFFAINHTSRPQRVIWPWYAREHLAGIIVDGTYMMEPYGVAVLTREKKPPVSKPAPDQLEEAKPAPETSQE